MITTLNAPIPRCQFFAIADDMLLPPDKRKWEGGYAMACAAALCRPVSRLSEIQEREWQALAEWITAVEAEWLPMPEVFKTMRHEFKQDEYRRFYKEHFPPEIKDEHLVALRRSAQLEGLFIKQKLHAWDRGIPSAPDLGAQAPVQEEAFQIVNPQASEQTTNHKPQTSSRSPAAHQLRVQLGGLYAPFKGTPAPVGKAEATLPANAAIVALASMLAAKQARTFAC